MLKDRKAFGDQAFQGMCCRQMDVDLRFQLNDSGTVFEQFQPDRLKGCGSQFASFEHIRPESVH